MIVRFHTIDTTAGIVKRSSEYRTPLMAPASERNRIVGSRMRSNWAASSAPAAGRGELGIDQLRQWAGGESEQRHARADDYDDEAQQVGRQLVGALALAFGEQRGEHRHERRADGGVGEQLLDEAGG